MKEGFEWQWNIKVLLFTAVFFPLTISLGFWQLERAAEKQDILSEQQARINAAHIRLSQVKVEQPQFTNVLVEVTALQGLPTLLLDNRVRKGRPGYEVLNVYQTKQGDNVLVNRGWLEGSIDRRILPDVPKIEAEVVLTGYLYRSPGKQLMLGEDEWRVGSDPVVVQNAAPEKVSEKLNLSLYPYTLRLEKGSRWALNTDWLTVNVQPEKHTAYAVQWFTIAFVLVVLTVFASSNLGYLIKRGKV